MVSYVAIAVIIAVAAIFLYRKRGKKKVPQGLQIFDANGNMILDYTDATCRIYGTQTIVGSKNGSGTISDSRIKASTAFVIPYNTTLDGVSITTSSQQATAERLAIQPTFTISNGKITWEYGSAQSGGAYIGMSILYGGRLS